VPICGVRLVPGDDRDVLYARVVERPGQPAQQRLTAHVEHAFRLVDRQLLQRVAPGGREHDGLDRAAAGEVAVLGLGQLLVAGEPEHVAQVRDHAFDVVEAFLLEDAAAGVAHRVDR